MENNVICLKRKIKGEKDSKYRKGDGGFHDG